MSRLNVVSRARVLAGAPLGGGYREVPDSGHPLRYEHVPLQGGEPPIWTTFSVPVQARMGPWFPSCSLQGNGLVSSDSWTKMLDFLDKHFM